MVVGKFVSKLVQSLPSWEMTKYYGRVAWFQLQCLKYRIQTSETWFNLMKKFMPNRLKNEAEYEDKKISPDKDKRAGSKKNSFVTSDESLAKVSKCNVLMEKLEKLGVMKRKNEQAESLGYEEESGSLKKCMKSKKKKSKHEK